MATKPICIDFETEAIEPRPKYPPKPVGVSLYVPGNKPEYLAWGHPDGNNCDVKQASQRLADIWGSSRELLFHNAAFDLEVAYQHLNLPIPSWDRVHDTLYLLFLHNPHARSLSLKPAAEALLNMPPEEANAVLAWLVKAGVVRPGDKGWGAHIAKAPGKLVGEYAIGDVVRTRRLYDLIAPTLTAWERVAYDRERRLMPILLDNEREGLHVDTDMLDAHCTVYREAMQKADDWLRKRLAVPSLNVDSNDDLANALDKQGIVTQWETTATGKRSTAKKNMTVDRFKDSRVFYVLGYRNRLATCLGTFMEPWLATAQNNQDHIFTRWNQVRQAHGADGAAGTRTGRLSCSPNFQNIPKDWYDKGDGYTHPDFLGVPPLPAIRQYILPDNKRHLFLHRDYNQQELRILAHFEDDKLCQAYRTNPVLDIHTWVQGQIASISGLQLDRRPVKILNFGTVYGMGTAKLAAAIGQSVDMATRIKAAQRAAIPGLRALETYIKQRAVSGEPITTWGGRRYYCEEPMTLPNGRVQTFEYKLLNYLIQGSAADCTKEAVIRYHTLRKEGRFLVTVHDEINLSCPKGAAKAEMLLLKQAMESVEFDVPMLTDGKVGPSWGELTKEK